VGYVIQVKFFGFWRNYDSVIHSELAWAEERLDKILLMRNCKDSQIVMVEKEV
jgi:hypothetical protein